MGSLGRQVSETTVRMVVRSDAWIKKYAGCGAVDPLAKNHA